MFYRVLIKPRMIELQQNKQDALHAFKVSKATLYFTETSICTIIWLFQQQSFKYFEWQ